ncbi:MAG: Rieske 2Fe-2S domain-containing protein [Rhodospirillaceae bacterium]|nr:Rieske 2Fe-2S domain-containing protein [Rhodospirillaceae bacterium]MBT4489731.1 Rieske 2Fe-2S domain-containing protein [Rhodospirillaceae bacterium]MBT5194141.1 Rieske 2Fe-2S domain-containing protein [Rhodospirillaceae bacterium]MBT5897853.1 Rieske 2Fe-2S domain-containing protein [Rhodospirillaceae bacterium]MBT7757826.1 Rieske 2Fe-2S domain-containing protein [Rhodospirillaceae bacterium]
MDQSTQIRLTREIFAHLDARTTAQADDVMYHATSAYSSPQRLALEKRILFREFPLLMGLSGQLPAPGDFLTDDFSGVPIVVVRDRKGAIRAFLNVCQHRGARLVDGCGHAGRVFSCPYHGWSYGLDGKLMGIPDQDSFAGVDKEGRGLVELSAVEQDGLIWVIPKAGAELDVETHLAGLGPELANYGLGGYHHHETRVLQRKLNWKIVIDTFLEPYHFGVLHANTVGPIFFPNLCLFEGFGPHLRETLPRRSIEDLRNLPEADWDLIPHTALVYVLFPNTVLVMQIDHVETWRVFPVGNKVDECIMYLDFFVPEPALTDSAKLHWDRNMDLTIRTVDEEDFPIGEGIQAGFASAAQTKMIFGRNEPALAHFERAINEAVDNAVRVTS